MKIAGRKNDGAWFRTNKAIEKLTDLEKGILANFIVALDSSGPAYTAVGDIATSAGFDPVEVPNLGSIEGWANSLVTQGIPRQVWYGILTTALYDKQETGVKGQPGYKVQYEKRGEAIMRVFAKDLRAMVSKFLRMRRQTRDLANFGSRLEGNPGGMPDTNKNT